MAKLLVMYGHPTDPAAFEAYYDSKHTPLARKVPGLRRLETSRGGINTPRGPSSYHRIAILHFDSLAALQAGIASPEGQATAADLKNFATGTVDMLIFDNADAMAEG